ncbi:MAG: hypothetical protein U0350_21115 [Caldilineaceae bacterium]
MNKLIRRTITVTISETWTVTWASEAETAAHSWDYVAGQCYTRVTQAIVHSSTVSSIHFFQQRQGEATHATIQAESNSPQAV